MKVKALINVLKTALDKVGNVDVEVSHYHLIGTRSIDNVAIYQTCDAKRLNSRKIKHANVARVHIELSDF